MAASKISHHSSFLVASLVATLLTLVTSHPEKTAPNWKGGDQDLVGELENLVQATYDDVTPALSSNDVIMILPLGGSQFQTNLLLDLLQSPPQEAGGNDDVTEMAPQSASNFDGTVRPQSALEDILNQEISAIQDIRPQASVTGSTQPQPRAVQDIVSQSSDDVTSSHQAMTSQQTPPVVQTTTPSAQPNVGSTNPQISTASLEASRTIPSLPKTTNTGSSQTPPNTATQTTAAPDFDSSKRGGKPTWSRPVTNGNPCRNPRRMNIVRFGKLPAVLFSNYRCLRKSSYKNGHVQFGRQIQRKLVRRRDAKVVRSFLYPVYGK